MIVVCSLAKETIMVWHLRQFPWLVPAAVSALVLISFGDKACVASDFQNLDFESAVIGNAKLVVRTSQGLPSWTTNSCDPGYIGYDTIALDSVGVSIHDSQSTFLKPLEGRYSVLLQRSSEWAVPPNEDAYVSQVGDIPPDATSLMYTTETNCAGLVVSLNGTTIPMSLYFAGWQINQNHGVVETFIGDIRQFTGQQNVELRFTGSGTLDDIQFSSEIVPEPSTLVLFTIGVVTACVYPFRRQRRAEKQRGVP
jgi:hypothetical protein